MDLAAEVGYQLFFSGGIEEIVDGNTKAQKGVEVTQLIHLDTTQQGDGIRMATGVAKKRKVDVSFRSCLLDHLNIKSKSFSRISGQQLENSSNDDETIIPYLQIIIKMLQKFSVSTLRKTTEGLTIDSIITIARTVLEAMQDAKNVRVKSMLIVACEMLLGGLNRLGGKLSSADFLRLWEGVANTVSLNQCVEEGNRLLR